ncbi:uncharacterized protein FIBRA_09366 [Fibroporia radiculosa]|uniref:Uncharacterized protein n=1 Tax=Fibroporia radiculosa TaxID=599839 RepID=J7SCC0_9APHY|nr:uncharacterized protein FIBRA_09366 [Fibroporia radiculosa]CCM07046.1 predicted protein [Fibroporia radiculosa]
MSPILALRALLEVISNSVDAIENRCRSRGLAFPSLDDPLVVDGESVQDDAAVQQAATLITSAAYQLIATVQQPRKTIFAAACNYYLPVSLRVATETNVVEILRDAGPEGLHVDEIAQQNGLDPPKLSRILRRLATNHIFREVRPDVFANNRLSSVCDTGKSVEELRARPLEKHEGTNGIPALIGHCTDEDYKGAGYILEHLTDPETAFEEGPKRTAMMRAFNWTTDVWTWFEQPFNKARFMRFGEAMNGVSNMQSIDSIFRGFSWESLQSESVVVDVGGGIGTSSLALAERYPELRLIVQDRLPVIEQGIKNLRSNWLRDNVVQYAAHDFFEEQSQKNAAVFLLKQILHDWSDSYAIRILRRLADAANTGTKLVLIENIVPYACRGDVVHIPGAENQDAPTPLLPNLGQANALVYDYDLSMYVHFNATERTLGQLVSLLEKGGWKAVRVHSTDHWGGFLQQIISIPMIS